jgi:hypothetical protein
MAEVYDVILHNEGEGTPILYDVRAANVTDALAEAWRQYRELPYVDAEAPPEWTQPIIQAALLRPNGEKPTGPYASSRRRWGDDRDLVEGLSPEAIRPYDASGAAPAPDATPAPRNLVEAASAIVRARDYFADHGEYDANDFHPDEDQLFDDWAADILETALAAEGEGAPA